MCSWEARFWRSRSGRHQKESSAWWRYAQQAHMTVCSQYLWLYTGILGEHEKLIHISNLHLTLLMQHIRMGQPMQCQVLRRVAMRVVGKVWAIHFVFLWHTPICWLPVTCYYGLGIFYMTCGKHFFAWQTWVSFYYGWLSKCPATSSVTLSEVSVQII